MTKKSNINPTIFRRIEETIDISKISKKELNDLINKRITSKEFEEKLRLGNY